MERGHDKQDIGDVNSTERGSGARFNTGKVRLDYVPAEVLHDFYVNCPVPQPVYDDVADRAMAVLYSIADFEERRGDEESQLALARALDAALDREQGVNRWRSGGECFDFGAKKYAAWNWAKGMAWSVPLACIKRHCVKILEGEVNDDESGVSHFGHIVCNLVMLMHYSGNYEEGDDRPPAQCFARDDGGEAEFVERQESFYPSVRGVIETELPELIRNPGAFDTSLLSREEMEKRGAKIVDAVDFPPVGGRYESGQFNDVLFNPEDGSFTELCAPQPKYTVQRCNDPGCLCHRTSY